MLLCAGAPVPGKQVCVVFCALFIFRDPVEDIFKPGPFVNATRFAGRQQGVDHGRSLCGIVVTAEQIVLATYGLGPDAVLYHVVVYLITPVGNIEGEFFQYLVGIGDGSVAAIDQAS